MPAGGTDAHADWWAGAFCHGLAAGPSCPTSGRPSVDAGPRTGTGTRHPRLLQPGGRPQPLGMDGGRRIGQPGTAGSILAGDPLHAIYGPAGPWRRITAVRLSKL